MGSSSTSTGGSCSSACARPTRRLKPFDSVSTGCSRTPRRVVRFSAWSTRSASSLPEKPRTLAQKRRKRFDRHLRVGRRAFRQEAQHPPCGDAVGLHVVALDARGAGCRDHEPGQHAHRGGFPRAVGTEEAQHLAAPDVEGDVVDRGECAEALGQAFDLDQRRLLRSHSRRIVADCLPPARSPSGVGPYWRESGMPDRRRDGKVWPRMQPVEGDLTGY